MYCIRYQNVVTDLHEITLLATCPRVDCIKAKKEKKEKNNSHGNSSFSLRIILNNQGVTGIYLLQSIIITRSHFPFSPLC